jgi:hypothetical protein
MLNTNMLNTENQTNLDKRTSDRIEVGGPAMLHIAGTGWSGYIKNVSARGVFFASACKVPAIGTEVTLTCEGGPGVLARVAWIGNSGCGLTLLKPLRS